METVLEVCIPPPANFSGTAASPSTSAQGPLSSVSSSAPTGSGSGSNKSKRESQTDGFPDRLIPLLCFYLNTRAKSAWPVTNAPDSERMKKTSTKGWAVSATTPVQNLQSEEADGRFAVRAALDASFRFLLSLLAAGAGQHPFLRCWLWKGVGAIPFTEPCTGAAVATDGDDVESENTALKRFGPVGEIVKHARPFPFAPSSRRSTGLAGSEDGEGREDADGNGGEAEAQRLALSPSDFLSRWAFLSLKRQEREVVAPTRRTDHREENVASPSTTTALRLARPPITVDSSHSTTAFATAAAAAGDEPVGRVVPRSPNNGTVDMWTADAHAPHQNHRRSGEERECETAYALASALLSVPTGDSARLLVRLAELPPIAVAYTLFESPAQRQLQFTSPVLLREGARDPATTSLTEEGKDPAPVFLAVFPPAGGVRWCVCSEDNERERLQADMFTLPAGFEQRLHDTFTCRLLSPSCFSPSPPAESERERYRKVRSSPVYEGSMAAAAAMFAYDLQVAARTAATITTTTHPTEDGPDNVVVKREEGQSCGSPRSSASLPPTICDDPPPNALTETLRKLEVLGFAPQNRTRGSELLTVQLRASAAAWSALLASLALSDGAPGQYVRSVLEPSGALAPSASKAANQFPPLSQLLLLLSEGDLTAALEPTHDHAERGAVTAREPTGNDTDAFGFGPELFLPTMEELVDYGECESLNTKAVPFFHLHDAVSPSVKSDEECRGNDEITTAPSCILQSAATLVAVALRHPKCMLYQLEQIFHCAAASVESVKPLEEENDGTARATHRKRRRDGHASRSHAAAAAAAADVEGDLVRKLTNLASVHAYSCAAGLALSPLRRQHRALAPATAQTLASVKKEMDARDEEEEEKRGNLGSIASLTEAEEELKALLCEKQGDEEKVSVPCPPPPPPPPKLRLKLSVKPAAGVKAKDEPEVKQEAVEDQEERSAAPAGANRPADSGENADTRNTHEFSERLPHAVGAAQAEEDKAKRDEEEQGLPATAVACPKEVMQECWSGTSAPDKLMRNGKQSNVSTASAKSVCELITQALLAFVKELSQDSSATSGSGATTGRLVLSLVVPASVKAFNSCLDRIAQYAHIYISCGNGAASEVSTAAEKRSDLSCDNDSTRQGGGQTSPSAVSARTLTTVSDLLLSVVGSCFTFAVYRTLSRLFDASPSVAPPLSSPVSCSFFAATLTQVTTALQSLSRSSRLRADRGGGHDGAALFVVPSLSCVLLPALLDHLERVGRCFEEAKRQAVAEAEADRRRRGVLSLVPPSVTATTPAAAALAAAEGLEGKVKELRALLHQLGMLLP